MSIEPAPLHPEQLDRCPGVLGKIARERAADYASAATVFDEATLTKARLVLAQRPSFKGALLRGAATAGEVDEVEQVSDNAHGLAVIAEVKRASPSQGSIADVNPIDAAVAYAQGGAAALSVLTEPRHFGGRLEHLAQVAGAIQLPLLRKEFTVHPAQIVEAALNGASAVLLIVAVLGKRTREYLSFAKSIGLDVLVEVHDEDELAVALEAGTDLLGVNNRDLKSLNIDLATAPRLIATARSQGFSGVAVAESGYRSAAELAELKGIADAALVGTSLVGSGDLAEALRKLRGA